MCALVIKKKKGIKEEATLSIRSRIFRRNKKEKEEDDDDNEMMAKMKKTRIWLQVNVDELIMEMHVRVL